MRKKGISMVVLIVTLIVMIILMSTIVLTLTTMSGKEKMSVFVHNLQVMEEYIQSSEILKEELPFEESMLRMDEIKNLVESDKKSDFEKELENNGENVTTTFRKIDMDKIGVYEKITGYGKKGEKDSYVYSESTGIVYYLAGISYKGNIYFSMKDEVTNLVK